MEEEGKGGGKAYASGGNRREVPGGSRCAEAAAAE